MASDVNTAVRLLGRACIGKGLVSQSNSLLFQRLWLEGWLLLVMDGDTSPGGAGEGALFPPHDYAHRQAASFGQIILGYMSRLW